MRADLVSHTPNEDEEEEEENGEGEEKGKKTEEEKGEERRASEQGKEGDTGRRTNTPTSRYELLVLRHESSHRRRTAAASCSTIHDRVRVVAVCVGVEGYRCSTD